MKLHLGRLQIFILVNPLPFIKNIVVKKIFVTCNNSLEKRVTSILWEKISYNGYAIVLILLTKSMRTSNTQLAHFNFFKWWQIVDWDVLRSSANSRVLLHRLYSTNSLKASWSRSDERPSLGSSLNDVSLEQNFENKFQT